jgi:hypothetical protein
MENYEISIEKIRTFIIQNEGNYSGLFYGITGQLLFFNEINDFLQVEKLISKISKEINEDEFGSYDFAYGLSGTFTTLIDLNLLDINDIEEICNKILNTIYNVKDGDFLLDPFQGLLGYFQLLRSCDFITVELAHYFIKRLISCETQYRFYKENDSSPAFNGKFAKLPNTLCNLGIAHGNGAILYWLYFFEQKFPGLVEIKNSRVSLENAFIELIGKTPENSLLSSAIYKNGSRSESSLGWCYSELPIAYLLLKHNNLSLENIKIVHQRIENISNNIDKYWEQINIDFGICHGVPGIYYLLVKLNRFICSKSISKTINRLQITITNHSNYSKDCSFLNGTSGFGLIINSIQNNQFDSLWDKYLLID